MKQDYLSFDTERGQVGIGTLIVFIALVLVAAIAAGVLLNVAGSLQEQGQQTGDEAQGEVANQLEVNAKVGTVASGANEISQIDLNVGLASGANEVDLSEATIDYLSSNGQAVLTFNSGGATAGSEFTVSPYQDTDGSLPVLNDNSDQAQVTLTFDSAGSGAALPLGENEEATLTIITADGGNKEIIVQTPKDLDTKQGEQVEL